MRYQRKKNLTSNSMNTQTQDNWKGQLENAVVNFVLRTPYNNDSVEQQKALTDLEESLNHIFENALKEKEHSTLAKAIEVVEKMKKVPTKHDLCTLDDCYCYNHKEIIKDEDYPNGAHSYNTGINDIVSALKSLSQEE